MRRFSFRGATNSRRRSVRLDIQDLVASINKAHDSHFVLQGKYATGENQGAYALSDDQGHLYVLKWNDHLPWIEALTRAQQVTTHLGTKGVPVPSYVLIDKHADQVLYWIQTALPGAPPRALSIRQAEQLVTFVERQAGQTLRTGSNWSEYVLAVVFAGRSGWRNTLAQHNDRTRAVVSRLTTITANRSALSLHANDICHGDMGTDNVLVQGHAVTGIVDWDAAGEGDRALDISKLLFYSYHIDDIRSLLSHHLIAISGQDAYVIYLAYNIFAQLDWSIHHHSVESVEEGVGLANRILDDLEAITAGAR